MDEKLLQFIWQYRHYHSGQLLTYNGEPLQVLHPGHWNKDQGPDFLNARIRVGDTLWAGHVEIHLNSSDWDLHGHSGDPHYDNVVLHVVWQHNARNAFPFPVLELCGRVPLHVIERCRFLLESETALPCASHLKEPDLLMLASWKERLLVERLEQRTMQIRSLLDNSSNHWGEVFWQRLFRSFGLHLNADAFERIACSLPLSIIRKEDYGNGHSEALLFGQASLLLPDYRDAYPIELKREYAFLAAKYRLKPAGPPPVFLRMRPVSFPTIRISQLAEVIRANKYLFSVIMEEERLSSIRCLFNVKAGAYWDSHYVFDQPASYCPKYPGEQMLNGIVLNAVVPVVFAYGHINRIQALKDRAIRWLLEMPSEKNRIVQQFELAGIASDTASESQSLLHLHQEYCKRKKCLQCAIGAKLIGYGV